MTDLERAKELLNKAYKDVPLSYEEALELDTLWLDLRFDTNPELSKELEEFYKRSENYLTGTNRRNA
jgi:hypothetical protein